MIKLDIIKQAAKQTGYTQEVASAIIEAAIACTTEALGRDEDVIIRGFGRFTQGATGEHPAHNFATGEAMTLPARKYVKFIPAQALKDSINRR